MQKFDAIVIGTGQGGTPLSKKLANAGFKTAIIEKRFVGGTCINDGCTPTKSMIASAKAAHTIRKSGNLGVHAGEPQVNLQEIIARKNKIVGSFRESAEKGLKETKNLTLVMGEATFSGSKTISVKLKDGGTETYTAENIFINTGTTPRIPEIEGISEVPYYTSTSLLHVDKVPQHLLIVGGGYIALEYAQMFRRFGSEVSIVVIDPVFLVKEDEDIATCLHDILTGEGIKIYTGAKAEKVTSGTEGLLALTIATKEERVILEGSHILLAAGRIPQTKTLQLDKTGVTINDKGFIIVDEYLQTSEPGIYALGDVKGGPAFTHISYNDYIVLKKTIIDKNKTSIKGRPIPYTMFTDPQLGRIGLTEKEAVKQKLNFQAVTLSMDKVARGIETGATEGMMKAIIDKDSKQILGASILGEEGGEVMTVLQMAMQGKITYEEIRENIFAHPLFSESLNNLFMSIDK